MITAMYGGPLCARLEAVEAVNHRPSRCSNATRNSVDEFTDGLRTSSITSSQASYHEAAGFRTKRPTHEGTWPFCRSFLPGGAARRGDPRRRRCGFYHLPSRIAQQITRYRFAPLKDVLQLVPLQFRHGPNEQNFLAHPLPAHRSRISFATCIGLVMLSFLWLTYGLALATGVFSLGRTATLQQLAFHATCFLLALSFLYYYLTTRVACLKAHFEITIYLVILFAILLPHIWKVLLIVLCRSTNGPSETFDPYRLQIWTTPLVLGIPLWNIVVLNFFMKTRTHFSFFPQLGIVLAIFIVNIVQAHLAGKLKHQRRSAQTDSFLFMVAFLESWSFLCIFCMCYFGRWSLELDERIEFWKSSISQSKLEVLREQRKQKKRGSTAVEDLLQILSRAMTDIQEAEVNTENKLLVESTELLRQFHTVLTNTDNLYAVPVMQQPQHSEGSPPVSAEITEAALLEAKFYEIYANPKSAAPQQGTQPPGLPSLQAASRQHLVVSSIGAAGLSAGTPAQPPGAPALVPQLPPEMAMVAGRIRNMAPLPQASAQFRRGVGRQWKCNILKGSEDYPHILVEVGALLLEPKSVYLRTSPIRIRNYVYRIERLYRANPYHNSAHGAMVAHSLCCFLRMLHIDEAPIFLPLDSVAVVIAALGHDAGHPGRNNQFYVNTFQRMAFLYNDRSVLENYHSALVFKSLEPVSCNIFEELESETVRGLRKKIIDLILATDMGLHFESVAKFRLRRQALGFNFMTDADDMWLVIRMCTKCADLSHALVDWGQHCEWSLRVAEEFYQQGAHEAYFGLPKSPLCDRNQHHEFPKSQKSFIEFVVLPLMSQMELLDNTDQITEDCLKHLTYNKYKWEEMYHENSTLDIPQHIKDVRTAASWSSSCGLLIPLLIPKGYRLVRHPLSHANGRGCEPTARWQRQHATPRAIKKTSSCDGSPEQSPWTRSRSLSSRQSSEDSDRTICNIYAAQRYRIYDKGNATLNLCSSTAEKEEVEEECEEYDTFDDAGMDLCGGRRWSCIVGDTDDTTDGIPSPSPRSSGNEEVPTTDDAESSRMTCDTSSRHSDSPFCSTQPGGSPPRRDTEPDCPSQSGAQRRLAEPHAAAHDARRPAVDGSGKPDRVAEPVAAARPAGSPTSSCTAAQRKLFYAGAHDTVERDNGVPARFWDDEDDADDADESARTFTVALSPQRPRPSGAFFHNVPDAAPCEQEACSDPLHGHTVRIPVAHSQLLSPDVPASPVSLCGRDRPHALPIRKLLSSPVLDSGENFDEGHSDCELTIEHPAQWPDL